jgi:hypothetical protein
MPSGKLRARTLASFAQRRAGPNRSDPAVVCGSRSQLPFCAPKRAVDADQIPCRDEQSPLRTETRTILTGNRRSADGRSAVCVEASPWRRCRRVRGSVGGIARSWRPSCRRQRRRAPASANSPKATGGPTALCTACSSNPAHRYADVVVQPVARRRQCKVADCRRFRGPACPGCPAGPQPTSGAAAHSALENARSFLESPGRGRLANLRVADASVMP